jgi:release factor glutamine methyltransferase
MRAPSTDVTAVREALAAATDALRAVGIEDPRLDAEVLLSEAVGVDRATLIADPGAEMPPAASRLFGEMVRRRLRREPVAYIAGRKGFRNIELAVDRRVLVPRPETELLVEVALERAPATALDVGTGSGAIALALADEMPGCAVTATDTSPSALEVARANAERLGLADRVRFLSGSVPEGEAYDLIVANLPYVAETEWSSLQPEVTQWEPREALLAGPDGLDAIEGLLLELERTSSRIPGRSAFAPGGALALEVGDGQTGTVEALLGAAGFSAIEIRADLAGIERVVLGER